MALTLPMAVLSNMKVSFKVGLSDGTFAFDMAPITAPADMVGLQPGSDHGMKLHLSAVAEAGSVVLTLSTSGQCINRVGEESMLDATSQSTSGQSGQSLDYSASNCVPDHAADHDRDEILAFMTHSQSIMMQEPLDPAFETLPLRTFDSPDGLFDLQAAQSNFNNLILDSFTLEYNHCNSDVTSFNHHEDGAGFTEASSDHDFTGLSDTDESSKESSTPPFPFDTPVTTPSASSESSFSASPAAGSRGSRSNLRCPEPGCARRFTRKYTLAKHVKAHEPKSQKFFPCTMGCSMRFSRRHDRLRHEVTQHRRVCEWGCSACLGFFSSESTLKKHKCRNPGGTRWICD
ncbi:hypothetical protein DFH09DRAFT_1317975 [Mycena vulgaris]|nr:hypothetical protein DFH09DRAFT_1317975 [Mycena vulgaris]